MGKRSGWWITHSLTDVVEISFVAPYIDVSYMCVIDVRGSLGKESKHIEWLSSTSCSSFAAAARVRVLVPSSTTTTDLYQMMR